MVKIEKDYRKFKLREEYSLGYYDNINNLYIITNHYKKVIDVIEKFQSGENE